MAFSQAAINYANEYSRALSMAYPYKSYFAAVWASQTSQRYKPGMGKTMYIPSLTLSGAHAVTSRDQITGTFNRNFNNSYQPVSLAMDREWDTLVDPMDIDETNMLASIANITRAFNELQKIPEMDAYMAAKLYGFANAADIDDTPLTGSNAVQIWNQLLGKLQNYRAPLNQIVCYMTPETHALMKTASGLVHYVDAGGAGQSAMNTNLELKDGVRVVVTPNDMLRTAYDFTEGWAPAADAGQIDMMFVDVESILAPVKYEASLISPPTAQSRGKWLYYERYYYDVFKLASHPGCVTAHIEATA